MTIQWKVILTSHLLVSTNDNVPIRIENFQIENTKREKLLGTKFDNKLSFDYHLSETCKKASRKLYALDRVTRYMNLSIYEYCPLICMCHSRIIKKKMNRLHERFLRIIYCDKQSLFEKSIEKDRSVSIYQRNIQVLATKVCHLLR